MKLKAIFAVVAAVTLVPLAAHAGTLTNVDITLSNTVVSSPTSVTMSYTTATTLTGGTNNNNLLRAVLTGVTFGAASCGPNLVVTADGTNINSRLNFCQTFGAGGIQLRLAPGETISAGAEIEVTLASSVVTTGAAPGVYPVSFFFTATDGGAAIDSPAVTPGVTLVSTPPAPVPTLSDWAVISLGLLLAGGAALTIQQRRFA